MLLTNLDAGKVPVKIKTPDQSEISAARGLLPIVVSFTT